MAPSYGSFGPEKSQQSASVPTGARRHSYSNNAPQTPGKHDRTSSLSQSPSSSDFQTGDVFSSVPPVPFSLRSPSVGSTGRRTTHFLALTDNFDLEAARADDQRPQFVQPPAVMLTPQMRSQRLIGNSNPRYRWAQYFKSEEELSKMKKKIRQYYERNNTLVQQYIYIDRLLDSSLPHNLIQEYHHLPHSNRIDVPPTITEESSAAAGSVTARSHSPTDLLDATTGSDSASRTSKAGSNGQLVPSALSNSESASTSQPETSTLPKVKRTPRNLYKIRDEETPLLGTSEHENDLDYVIPSYSPADDDIDTTDDIVMLAIRVNLVANVVLLVMKIAVTAMTSSVSVLASLVDAALDFLSTAIVWTTTFLISRQDHYSYPAGRRRLEPIGVLVFSVIMTTSFVQVGIEGVKKLTSGTHEVVELGGWAIGIMGATVVVKLACWFWCRLVKNSSVQALAQDAMTDVIFNTFSIIFPFAGFFLNIWWMDPLGGILLSVYVIVSWTSTSIEHIRNLSGAAATADERNVLLYLTMRFARTIKQIQGLQAYHGGDKLIVEVDIVVDENMLLRDSHDLGESLQYVLESVPFVDRAFVHLDYASYNLPTHMQQQE